MTLTETERARVVGLYVQCQIAMKESRRCLEILREHHATLDGLVISLDRENDWLMQFLEEHSPSED